jgi:tetratricopeptide (TPR) repeat protein
VLTSLFDLISLLYLFRSLQAVLRLVRSWRAFWDADVTGPDRRLANELAFYVFIPLGVFLHEAGHALATWQVGGRVLEFQWRVFWGYIVPVGSFTPLQEWWIALSGNLVSIALGLLPLALLLLVRTGIWAELLESIARQQLLYALIWYPAFTFLGFGDWVTIYDFRVAPYAQIMLVAHLGLLGGLWWLNRSPWAVGLRLARQPAALVQARQQLEAAVAAQPASAAPLVALAHHYLQTGEPALAQRALKRAAALDPNNGPLLFTQAQLAFQQRRNTQAERTARAALMTDLPPAMRAQLHGWLAFALMQAGRRDEAVAEFSAALDLRPGEYNWHYWRGIVRRSLGRRAEAQTDFEQAARLAPDPASQARARQELDPRQVYP